MVTQGLEFLARPCQCDCFEQQDLACASFPDEPALICDGLRQTHAQFQQSVHNSMRLLQQQGVESGTRILMLVTNRAEQVWLSQAALRLGGLLAAHEIRIPAPQAVLLAQDFQPQLLIYEDCVADKVQEILAGLKQQPRTLAIGTHDSADLCYSQALEALAEDEEWTPPARDIDAPACVFYRMDREDHWRGVTHSLRGLSDNAQQTRTLFTLSRGSRVLCHMPVAHYLSLASLVLPVLSAAGCLVLMDRSANDDQVLDAIEEHNPRLMIHYRRYYWHLMNQARERVSQGRALGQVRFALVSADSPQLPWRDTWDELFGGHLLSGFASWVGGGFLALNLPWLYWRDDYVGKPLPGVDMQIVDESGHTRPTGRWGEIVFRSPRMASGWVREDPVNPEVWEEGWLRTQQMASLDTDGYLTLADEVFDVIWVNGFKVSPLEIEEPMLQLPGIREVVAVNAARNDTPDRIQVFVVQDDNAYTEQSLLDELVRLFPPYLCPAQVSFIDEVPLDDEGFKLRKELKFKYQTPQSWRAS